MVSINSSPKPGGSEHTQLLFLDGQPEARGKPGLPERTAESPSPASTLAFLITKLENAPPAGQKDPQGGAGRPLKMQQGDLSQVLGSGREDGKGSFVAKTES